MKKTLSIALLFFALAAKSQNVGIGNTDPKTILDVKGDVRFRSVAITLPFTPVDLDITTNKASVFVLSSSGIGSIPGINGGIDGKMITLFNGSSFSSSISIADESSTQSSATANNRIITGNAGFLFLNQKGSITLRYDGTLMRWTIVSKNGVDDSSNLWGKNGSDVFNNNSGNVGIGNSTPLAKLDVTGNLKIADGTQGAGKILTSDANGFASWATASNSSWSESGNNIFNSNTGNVGIGANSAQNKFQIGSVPNASGSQFAIGNGTQSMTLNQTATATTFNNGSNSYYSFMGDGNGAAGNVGIGTLLPAEAKLVVNAAANINISAAFGTNGNGISIQKNWPTISYNAYRDFNNTNRYMGNGYGFSTTCDPTTGLFQFNTLGSGTAGTTVGANEAFAMGITATGNVGIGLTVPSNKLTILSNNVNAASNTDVLQIAGKNPLLNVTDANGNPYAYLKGITNRTSTPQFSREGLEIGTGGGDIYFTALGYQPALMIKGDNNNVGIGTNNPTYKLSVNGNIRAKEIVVETGWADYVFADEYKLPTLNTVETDILKNKHLTGIPSAKDIEANGLNVGEVQKKMMEKIEELTLYIIQQHKAINLLKEQNEKLTAAVNSLIEKGGK